MAEVNSVLSRCCWWWYFIKAVSSIRATWHSGNSADSNKTANDRTGKCSQHKRYTHINSYTSHSRSYKDKDTSFRSGAWWWWWFWEWSWARRSNWCDTRATKTGRGFWSFCDRRQESKSEFCYTAKNCFLLCWVWWSGSVLEFWEVLVWFMAEMRFITSSKRPDGLSSPLMLLTQWALNWNYRIFRLITRT